MAWWIYIGKVTTPVSGGVTAVLNEKGDVPVIMPKDPNVSTVLVPRLKFEASMSSISHLVRLKRVAALKPHQIPKTPETKAATTVPEKLVVAPKSEAKEPKGTPTDGKAPVVASDAIQSDSAKTGESKSKAKQEKQEKGGSRSKDERRG